jgi:hypothetical protein
MAYSPRAGLDISCSFFKNLKGQEKSLIPDGERCDGRKVTHRRDVSQLALGFRGFGRRQQPPASLSSESMCAM